MFRICLLALGLCFSVPAWAEKPLILVSNYPLQWLCEVLVAGQAEVINLTKDAESPRDWVPDPQAQDLIERADLLVLQGAGYENWARHLELNNAFRSSEAVFAAYSEHRKLEAEAQHLFYQQTQGRTWLDPLHLKLQAKAISAKIDALGLNSAAALKTIGNELDAVTQRARSRERVLQEFYLGLDPVLELTLAREWGWRIRSVDLGEGESFQEAFEERYNTAPGRSAFRIQTAAHPQEEWMQQKWRVWTLHFNCGERVPQAEQSYPELLNENISKLFSLYTR